MFLITLHCIIFHGTGITPYIDILAKENKVNTGLVTGDWRSKDTLTLYSLQLPTYIYLHHPLDYKIPHIHIRHILLTDVVSYSRIILGISFVGTQNIR